MKRIGVLVSGSGSNLQAIIDATQTGFIPAKVGLVISNKPGVLALQRALKSQIPSITIEARSYPSPADFSTALLTAMKSYEVDLVCLAGFLRILTPVFIEAFPNQVLNIHPALLPAFGGKGMYGHYVHEAVIAAGVKYSGATVHVVTPTPDVGPIISQGLVEIDDSDTAKSLAAKVLTIEHQIYPQAIKLVIEEKIMIDGLRVRLLKR